jgi:hypothetical protein
MAEGCTIRDIRRRLADALSVPPESISFVFQALPVDDYDTLDIDKFTADDFFVFFTSSVPPPPSRSRVASVPIIPPAPDGPVLEEVLRPIAKTQVAPARPPETPQPTLPVDYSARFDLMKQWIKNQMSDHEIHQLLEACNYNVDVSLKNILSSAEYTAYQKSRKPPDQTPPPQAQAQSKVMAAPPPPPPPEPEVDVSGLSKYNFGQFAGPLAEYSNRDKATLLRLIERHRSKVHHQHIIQLFEASLRNETAAEALIALER